MAITRQIQLQWDVIPIWPRRAESTDELVGNSVEELKNRGFAAIGELAIIAAGAVTYAGKHKAVAQANIMRVINIGQSSSAG